MKELDGRPVFPLAPTKIAAAFTTAWKGDKRDGPDQVVIAHYQLHFTSNGQPISRDFGTSRSRAIICVETEEIGKYPFKGNYRVEVRDLPSSALI